MLLFVLVGETLNQLIKKNDEIIPLRLPNTIPQKLCQFADDTSVATKSAKSLEALNKTLECYERASGARVNKDKTEIRKKH